MATAVFSNDAGAGLSTMCWISFEVLGQAGLDGFGIVAIRNIPEGREPVGQGAGSQERVSHEATVS